MNRFCILGIMLAPWALSCSSDSTADAGTDSGSVKDTGSTTDSGKDSGGMDAGMDTGAMDAGADAGFMLNGCTDNNFVDKSQGGNNNRQTAWDLQQSFPMCFTINAGQQFTWNGAFASHPLQQAGGSMNSPIMTTNSGTTVTFTFPNAGNYGFNCTIHNNMRGVIRVK